MYKEKGEIGDLPNKIFQMTPREISKKQFNTYNHFINPIASQIGTQKLWFELDTSNIIGTVILDNIDNDWSWVLMAEDEDGEFRFADGQVSLNSIDEARKTLLNKMIEYSKEGIIKSTLYQVQDSDLIDARVITDIDSEVKKYFGQYPEKLYSLNPRKFEELVASIFEDFGFSVELTKATRDGGRDIIAQIRNSVTNFLTYVECKKYEADNKVGVGIIREVAGVHHIRNPHKSIIVTTSFFTKDAKQEAKIIKNRLELKDFNHLKEWLNRY